MTTIKKVQIHSGVEYETYEYVWNLHNYGVIQESLALVAQQKFEMQVGRSRDVQSKWLVGLRPGSSGGSGGSISVYFRLLEKVGDDESKISTRISMSYGKTEESLNLMRTLENATAQNEEIVFDSCFIRGRPAFELRTATDKSGTFVLHFKVELLASHAELTDNPVLCFQELKTASFKRLHGNFSKLLEDKDTHDIKIVCNDGVEIGAHKIILSAQNPVFATMFESDLSENRTGVIKIEDVSGNTMKLLLHYLYTGELLPGWRQPETIVEFTFAAGKYQLADILQMLDGMLGNDDDSTCNLVLLNLANKLSLKSAEAKLMQRIVKMTNAANGSADLFAIFERDC